MRRPYPMQTLKEICREQYLEARAIDAERHYGEQLEKQSEQERRAVELRRFGMIVR